MNSLDLSLTEEDESLFDQNYDKIIAKTKNVKDKILEPTMDEKVEIYKIVMDFVKRKKRKIYGGFALNKLLINKNQDEAIYNDEVDEPDIDFYSPEPIKDLIELCNIIHEAGYKNIQGKEAQHVGTYKVYVNWNKECCDITYVPNNIYKKIRFIEINEYYYTHPWFMMIDIFRVFTDPITSYRSLDKYVPRFKKLEKYYSLPIVNKILKLNQYKNKNIKMAMDDVFENFLIKHDTIMFCGFYIYNYYLNISEISKINSDYKYVEIPYYEIYSINYINDGLDLIEYFKNSKYSNNIEYEELYPLFQYFGNSTTFYFVDGKNRHPIIYLYNNNKRCMPYKKVIAKTFDTGNEVKNLENEINIGSFDYNILHILILLLKIRIEGNNDMNDTLYTVLSGYSTFRKHYLKENEKTKYDDTLFESFIADCMGKPLDPSREKRIRTNIRYKMKKPTEYRYDPENNKGKYPKYTQPNMSGFKILNKKHFQLVEDKRYYNKEDIIKDEEENGENEE
jgi:hypothetical protein